MEDPTADKSVKQVTIYDVAKEAGVAPSTVSRALSRPGRVSERTTAKILEAANRLGYRSKTSPGTRGKAKILLVSAVRLGSRYYQETFEGIAEEAEREGFTVIVVDGTLPPDNTSAIERVAHLADAIIMISPRETDARMLEIAKKHPLVVINRVIHGVASVVQNVPDGMRQVAEHLEELGHTNVLYVAGPADSWIEYPRWESLQHECESRGMKAHRIGPFEASVLGGVEAARTVIQRDVGAVVAYNDDMAVGMMRSLQDSGVRVPEDISVVGIDNLEIAPLIRPPLTTAALAARGQGVLAVKTVAELRKGNPPQIEVAVVPMKLIVRESTGPAPAKKS